MTVSPDLTPDPAPGGPPRRVRALAVPPPTAPTEDHAAVWLEEDGAVWADCPTSPPADLMLPMVWDTTGEVSRHELEARGATLTRIADCRTDTLATPRPWEALGAADHAAVWLDSHGYAWADYPTTAEDALVRPLVWASEVAESRADLEACGHAFTRIGWSR